MCSIQIYIFDYLIYIFAMLLYLYNYTISKYIYIYMQPRKINIQIFYKANKN